MGRGLRSIFVVFGLLSVLICEYVVIGGLGMAAGIRAGTITFGFMMELFSVGFVVLLQKPCFPKAAAIGTRSCVNRPLRWLAVLFGLLQIYPGASALLIGIFDSRAFDRGWMIGFGAIICLTALLFIHGGLRGQLPSSPRPETRIEA